MYYHADPKAVYESYIGDGNILLENIKCVGNETNLLECIHGVEEYNCGYFGDAGVSCGNFQHHFLTSALCI